MNWPANLRFGPLRTYAVQKGTSALPQKADVCAATTDVRYGPIADIHLPIRAVTSSR